MLKTFVERECVCVRRSHCGGLPLRFICNVSTPWRARASLPSLQHPHVSRVRGRHDPCRSHVADYYSRSLKDFLDGRSARILDAVRLSHNNNRRCCCLGSVKGGRGSAFL